MRKETALRTLVRGARTRGANGHNDKFSLEGRASLLRASLVLRGIRQRYETGRTAFPSALCYSVQVAIDSGDMAWITAAIDLVEKALVVQSLSETRTGNQAAAAVARRLEKNLAEETAEGAAGDHHR